MSSKMQQRSIRKNTVEHRKQNSKHTKITYNSPNTKRVPMEAPELEYFDVIGWVKSLGTALDI